jgi:Flp pilus assembly protein TadG
VSTLRRGTKVERGQAAVEFALVLPFLLVMLIGIIEFGRAWNEHQVITDAAREAARKGVLHDALITEDTVRHFAKRALAAAAIDSGSATVTVNQWPVPSNEPLIVTISLPYQFTFFGPLVKWTTGQSNITLQTFVTMRKE